MYNVTIFDDVENVTVRELTALQVGELQTALIRHGLKHNIEPINEQRELVDIGDGVMVDPLILAAILPT